MINNLILFGILAFLLLGVVRTDAFENQDSIEGNWIGEMKFDNAAKFVRIKFSSENSSLKADLEFRGLATEVQKFDLEKVTFENQEIHFALNANALQLRFEGRLTSDGIAGNVFQGAASGKFNLIREASLSQTQIADLYGIYQVTPNRFIWVGKFIELGTQPFFFDSQTGRFGPLYSLSNNEFVSGQAILSPFFPIEVKIKFERNNKDQIIGLAYSQDKSESVKAQKVALVRETLKFKNDAVTLVGEVIAPSAKGGKHPAIVLVHGSNDEDRDYLKLWAEIFAAQGFAVLSYDKRGVRDSTGDWKTSNFEDLAKDVLAGVDLLKKRKNINAKKIGLWGVSQAGWIAPVAAARSKDVSFIMLHAGAMVTPSKQGLQSIESELKAYGFPDDEVKKALAYNKLDDDFTRTGEGWENLQRAYSEASKQGAEWLLSEPQPKDFWFRLMFRRVMDFDSIPYWKKVNVPVLAFFGEFDRTVPPEPSKTILENTLKQAGNRNVETRILPKANHLFLSSESGVRTEYPALKSFVPEYFAQMTKWLISRAILKTLK